jgi:hypothetical protein
MFSKNLTKRFKVFGSGFTELHTKFDGDIVLDPWQARQETK